MCFLVTFLNHQQKLKYQLLKILLVPMAESVLMQLGLVAAYFALYEGVPKNSF